MERDYKNAHKAYLKLIELRKLFGLSLYESEALRMALTWREIRDKKGEKKFLQEFKDFCDRDETIYRHMNFAIYNAYTGNKTEAFKEMRLFIDEDHNFHYCELFLDLEPYIDSIHDTPEYKELYKKLQTDFQQNKVEIRKLMETKGLL